MKIPIHLPRKPGTAITTCMLSSRYYMSRHLVKDKTMRSDKLSIAEMVPAVTLKESFTTAVTTAIDVVKSQRTCCSMVRVILTGGDIGIFTIRHHHCCGCCRWEEKKVQVVLFSSQEVKEQICCLKINREKVTITLPNNTMTDNEICVYPHWLHLPNFVGALMRDEL